MYFSRSIVATALLGYASAQSIVAGEVPTGVVPTEAVPAGTAPAAEVPSGAGVAPPATEGQMVMTHVVQVGGPNGTNRFYPENVIAQPGDLVQFQFNPKNHSVAQSTFDNPCVPIQNIMPNKTDAFYSGFMPSNGAPSGTNSTAGTTGRMTYTIRVMDSTPIWFYCSQDQHCQNGMVGAINAVATGNKTMEGFKALAAQAPENLSPGQQAGEGIQTDPSGTAPGSATPSGGAGGESGGAGGESGGSPTEGEAPTGTTVGNSPAEQSVSAGHSLSSQSFLSLTLGGLAAFLVL